MAKELPYFKFEPQEWDNGNIQMCSRESKGLFIDLCSIYWSRVGELPYALALQKLCNGNKDAMQELIELEIITVTDSKIVIQFLDEQLSEFSETVEKRRNAANKRWNDARALQKDMQCNATRQDKTRQEETKQDERVVAVPATPDERAKVFMERIAEHLNTYPKEMLRNFYDYWTEKNEGGRRMRFEMQKVFDLKKRLATWSKRENEKINGKQRNGITAQGTLDRLNGYH